MAQSILAVGIDPAKEQHQAVAVRYPDEVVLDVEVDNDVPDIRALDVRVAEIADRYDAEVVYGVEDHRRHGRRLVEVLQQNDREIRVVNPAWTNRQKEFYGEDKNDSIDARAVAAVVLRRRDKLPDATDRDEVVTALREAERNLQDLSEQRTKALSRLHGQLADVYPPAYSSFFGKLQNAWALRFFARFPLPQDLEGHDRETLAPVLEELANGNIGPLNGQSRQARLRARADQIIRATAGVRQLQRTPAMDLKAELIRQLCHELLENHQRWQRLERIVAHELLPKVDQQLTTLPGVADVLAATILGEIGDIRRFPDRNAFAKYNGTAPAQNSSGGRQRHRARRGCNHRLKRAFWLAAAAAVRHDDLAEAYYNRCLARGLTKLDSLKRVARRLSDIVYAMLTRGEAYDRRRLQPAGETQEAPEAGGTASKGQNAHTQAPSLTGSRSTQTNSASDVAQSPEVERPQQRAKPGRPSHRKSVPTASSETRRSPRRHPATSP